MIPYGKHSVDQADIDAVVDVLKNQFLTQGQQVPAFESALANYCGAGFATAVNSGTSALHIACMALGLGQGDWLWTSPISFVASSNCALYCGAQVDFVDIDPDTRNICVEQLASKLATAERRPKVLVAVHFAGSSCDMQAIKTLCERYDVAVIEDASHGLGGDYQQGKIGCSQFSDMTVLSFHPVKSITSAEGGAVLTNDAQLHMRCQLASKHGITRDQQLMQGESEGDWYYQQIVLGYNYRLSDLHAALGISQLSKLDNFIQRRRQLAARYHQKLHHLPLTLPQPDEQSAWHIYVIEVEADKRKAAFDALRQAGIGVNVHYIPIHLQPFYRQLGFQAGDFPRAEHFYAGAITLPLYADLTEAEQDKVVETLQRVLA